MFVVNIKIAASCPLYKVFERFLIAVSVETHNTAVLFFIVSAAGKLGNARVHLLATRGGGIGDGQLTHEPSQSWNGVVKWQQQVVVSGAP